MNAPVPSNIALQWAPLSFAQQRLWFFTRLESGSSAYNIGGLLRFEGALDTAALPEALDEVASGNSMPGCVPAGFTTSVRLLETSTFFASLAFTVKVKVPWTGVLHEILPSRESSPEPLGATVRPAGAPVTDHVIGAVPAMVKSEAL